MNQPFEEAGRGAAGSEAVDAAALTTWGKPPQRDFAET